jgi:hypothetical protein
VSVAEPDEAGATSVQRSAREYLEAGHCPLVLLGAGASVEAGVPDSTTMTRAIAEAIQADGHARYEGADRALNFCIGALLAHDSAKGRSPYGGVDVELIFSAVQMLAERENLEISPFVQSWHPAVDAFGPRASSPLGFDGAFVRALESPSHNDLSRLLTEFVENIAGRKARPQVYRNLQGSMTTALRGLLRVPADGFEHLRPLTQLAQRHSRIVVATLNYDLGVETLAGSDCPVDTGIAAWTGGLDWTFNQTGGIHLLKLHGSIDWRERDVGSDFLSPHHIDVEQGPEEAPRALPVVVFGQRGKLRADGPFLAMLRAFDEALSRTDRLLVVGYSFRDDHVNVIIRRWLSQSAGHGVVLVEPGYPFPREELSYGHSPSFRAQMDRWMGVRAGAASSGAEQRLYVEVCGAGEGLTRLLS